MTEPRFDTSRWVFGPFYVAVIRGSRSQAVIVSVKVPALGTVVSSHTWYKR